MLLQIDVHLRIVRQKLRQALRQERVDRIGVGEETDAAPRAARVLGHVRIEAFDVGADQAGILEHGLTGKRRHHAFGVAFEQRDAEKIFQRLQPQARCRHGHERPLGTPRQAAGLGNINQEFQVGQVVPHAFNGLKQMLSKFSIPARPTVA